MSSLRNSYRILTFNPATQVDVVHQRMHRGEFFTVSHIETEVIENASIEILFRVANNSASHTRIRTSSGADLDRSIFENVIVSDDGTLLNRTNRNRFSSKISSTLVFLSPTVINEGNELLIEYSPGGAGSPFSQGSSSGIFEEIILNSGDYLFRLTNTSSSTQKMNLIIDYYNPGLLP